MFHFSGDRGYKWLSAVFPFDRLFANPRYYNRFFPTHCFGFFQAQQDLGPRRIVRLDECPPLPPIIPDFPTPFPRHRPYRGFLYPKPIQVWDFRFDALSGTIRLPDDDPKKGWVNGLPLRRWKVWNKENMRDMYFTGWKHYDFPHNSQWPMAPYGGVVGSEKVYPCLEINEEMTAWMCWRRVTPPDEREYFKPPVPPIDFDFDLDVWPTTAEGFNFDLRDDLERPPPGTPSTISSENSVDMYQERGKPRPWWQRHLPVKGRKASIRVRLLWLDRMISDLSTRAPWFRLMVGVGLLKILQNLMALIWIAMLGSVCEDKKHGGCHTFTVDSVLPIVCLSICGATFLFIHPKLKTHVFKGIPKLLWTGDWWTCFILWLIQTLSFIQLTASVYYFVPERSKRFIKEYLWITIPGYLFVISSLAIKYDRQTANVPYRYQFIKNKTPDFFRREIKHMFPSAGGDWLDMPTERFFGVFRRMHWYTFDDEQFDNWVWTDRNEAFITLFYFYIVSWHVIGIALFEDPTLNRYYGAAYWNTVIAFFTIMYQYLQMHRYLWNRNFHHDFTMADTFLYCMVN